MLTTLLPCLISWIVVVNNVAVTVTALNITADSPYESHSFVLLTKKQRQTLKEQARGMPSGGLSVTTTTATSAHYYKQSQALSSSSSSSSSSSWIKKNQVSPPDKDEDRALGGKKKAKGGKKAGKKKGKKGGDDDDDDDCNLFLDECSLECSDFFESISSMEPSPTFCLDTCTTCSSCDCTEGECFQTCACDEFIQQGLFAESTNFECCDQILAFDPQIALDVGCPPCDNPLYAQGCNAVFEGLFGPDGINEPIPEGLCENNYCVCSAIICPLVGLDGGDVDSCNGNCFCHEVLEDDPASNPIAASTCPSCTYNPQVRQAICEDFPEDEFGTDFCDATLCPCLDKCYKDTFDFFLFFEENYFAFCYEECICDTIDPLREGQCNEEFVCLEGCKEEIQEPFMLDDGTTELICDDACGCITSCTKGDLLCERTCGCNTVRPGRGVVPNQDVYDGLNCPCVDSLTSVGGVNLYYGNFQLGCLDDCEDACELILGEAGQDAPIEEVCHDKEPSACGCLNTNCILRDPPLTPEEFNICASDCFCHEAEYLVFEEFADPAVLDFLGCEV
mmetsp:Transcript_657/g.1952  ORF Transcript_657/g.1952 Transcript_657/m.1952 type:complete len:563 (+) Transcript_657:2148-3836(+)